MDTKTLQRIIVVLLLLVLVRGLIYGLVIPFDQTPDERYYFELIKSKHFQIDPLPQKKMLQIMGQLEVTTYYQLHPDADPGKFAVDLDDVGVQEPPENQDFYFFSMAWLLKLLSLKTIRDEIFAIRGVSILCGMLVVMFSFLVIRELFPENVFLLVGVPTFITFIPQFSATNVAVNSDKFVEVFAALLFWLVVRIFKQGMNTRLFSAYLVMMVLAWFSKRTAVFMVPFLIITLLVYYWKGSLGFRMHLVLIAILLTLAYGLFYVLYNYEVFYDFFKQYVTRIPVEDMREGDYWRNLISPSSLRYYAKFFTLMYWSFWGVFGYMSIHVHHFWFIGAALVQMLSIGGLLWFVIQVRMKHRSVERWKGKILYVFAVSIVLMTLVVFMRSIMFRPGSPFLPQGRRLFTVIIPISILTLFGLDTLVPCKYHRIVAALGLICLFALDVVCLSNHILLNFHRLSFF